MELILLRSFITRDSVTALLCVFKNTARSALASVIVLQGNQSFGNHPLVSRFLKGTFTTRPTLPKYKEVWDVNTVLEHLKTLHPAKSESLKLLTLKLVMLMAILSGQRCQTIHALTTRDMKVSDSKVVFIVIDLLKTTKPDYYLLLNLEKNALR